jgi:hypothetical protein
MARAAIFAINAKLLDEVSGQTSRLIPGYMSKPRSNLINCAM